LQIWASTVARTLLKKPAGVMERGRLGPHLKDRCKQNPNPPAENVRPDTIRRDPEGLDFAEDAEVKDQHAGLYDRHCTGVQDLEGEHDLALRQEFLGVGKPRRGCVGAVVLLFAETGDGYTNDVVDGDT